jgi:hypothetical protein
MAKFKGSPCLTGDCGGHKAGYKYANNGGGTYSPYSQSFNNGMNIANGKMNFQNPKPKGLSKTSITVGLGIAAAVAAATKKPTP